MDTESFFYRGGKTGCLLIHGGTGSPPEMRPMGKYLADQGLTVSGIRLAGHGTTPEDLSGTTWPDLIYSAEEGLERLRSECETVFVGGLSLGGLITLYLAARHPFRGAIVMSAPAYIRDWRLRFLPIVRLFIRWHSASGELDATDPQTIERVSFYRRVPISFGSEFQSLLKAVHSGLSDIRMPLLFMQGACDRSIPPESAQFFYDRVRSHEKEIIIFPNSGHPITVDTEREAVWRCAYEFITRNSV